MPQLRSTVDQPPSEPSTWSSGGNVFAGTGAAMPGQVGCVDLERMARDGLALSFFGHRAADGPPFRPN